MTTVTLRKSATRTPFCERVFANRQDAERWAALFPGQAWIGHDDGQTPDDNQRAVFQPAEPESRDADGAPVIRRYRALDGHCPWCDGDRITEWDDRAFECDTCGVQWRIEDRDVVSIALVDHCDNCLADVSAYGAVGVHECHECGMLWEVGNDLSIEILCDPGETEPESDGDVC